MSQQTFGDPDKASGSQCFDPLARSGKLLSLLLALAISACAHPVWKPRAPTPTEEGAQARAGENRSASEGLSPVAADARRTGTEATQPPATGSSGGEQLPVAPAEARQAGTLATEPPAATGSGSEEPLVAAAGAREAGTVAAEPPASAGSRSEELSAAAADQQSTAAVAAEPSANVRSENQELSPAAGNAGLEASAAAQQPSLAAEASGAAGAAASEWSVPADARAHREPRSLTDKPSNAAQGSDSAQSPASGAAQSSVGQAGESSGQLSGTDAAAVPETIGQQEGGLGGIAGASAEQPGNAATSTGAKDATATADNRIASIDVPTGQVKIDEEYRPQTLGGTLPLVLGVNEDGRFDFDQYALRAEVKRILDQLAEKLNTAEYDRLDIVGYTDRIGTADYNQRLSELRAFAVAQYLLAKGVPENKIHYQGEGDKNPLTRPGECTGLARTPLIACLQKDRRVEIEASIHRKHATIIQ